VFEQRVMQAALVVISVAMSPPTKSQLPSHLISFKPFLKPLKILIY
jgi:hypothetical protein